VFCVWSVTTSVLDIRYVTNEFEVFRWSLLKNSCHSYESIYEYCSERKNMHFVLYRYCCKGRYSINIHLKCQEKSGNLIITGEWPSSLRFIF